MHKPKLRIAWFSNLPGDTGAEESYSAYFSELILPELAGCELELFHNGFEAYGDWPTFHYLKAAQRHAQKPFDIFFYQLEDRPAAQWLRTQVGLNPGLVYFHDYLFTSFGPEPILNSTWFEIVKKFKDPTTNWPDQMDKQFQQGPHARREASFAAATIFSQPQALDEYRRSVLVNVSSKAVADSFYLPLPVAPEVFNARLPKAERVCYSGSPWIQDRGHKVLQAVAEYSPDLEFNWLVSATEVSAAQALVKEFGLRNVNLQSGRSPAVWKELISKGGVALHTLFSVFGQTGAYLNLSLSVGIPTVVTRFGCTDHLPEQIVYKVQPGASECTEIKAVLQELFGKSSKFSRDLCQTYARENFAAPLVANELEFIFRSSLPEITQTQTAWLAYQQIATLDVLKQARASLPEVDQIWGVEELFTMASRDFNWESKQ